MPHLVPTDCIFATNPLREQVPYNLHLHHVTTLWKNLTLAQASDQPIPHQDHPPPNQPNNPTNFRNNMITAFNACHEANKSSSEKDTDERVRMVTAKCKLLGLREVTVPDPVTGIDCTQLQPVRLRPGFIDFLKKSKKADAVEIFKPSLQQPLATLVVRDHHMTSNVSLHACREILEDTVFLSLSQKGAWFSGHPVFDQEKLTTELLVVCFAPPAIHDSGYLKRSQCNDRILRQE